MDNTQVKKKSVGKRILSILLDIIVVLYLLGAVLICVFVFTSQNNDGVPSVFGYNFLIVETDSMETDKPDSINEGDLIIGKKLSYSEAEKLVVGDVISFWKTVVQDGNEFKIIVDHRIIELENNDDGYVTGYITQGDNREVAPEPDPVVPIGNVICKYTGTKLSGVGKVFNFLKSQNGILFCLVIPLAAFFIYAVFKFVKAFMEYKISKNPESVLTEEQKQKAIEEYLASQKMADENKQKITDNNSDSPDGE